ncbi:hypothetical protein BMT55_07075 [Listeria newyorkensis]|uniref:Uncharacterized protein n=1 Tax=Listeria newyorkensis TaxID=1497681 RepID=A0ABX4XMZ5_9LIST|nr:MULTISPECIES: GHKL domain-containing protein [Listeria]KGL42313.1 hypothetical protein EP56_08845 [Listeriaceae bacterium FSL A5-0209]KGL38743.1 hypothetical protein EP58_15020 [Listeria newyorkensis]KMT62268.1 ATPase [Listeria newyorkensis]PNP92715.1 hypothetical protein BMT55_07075 [Listeria newyorkensis]RQW66514.1 hypothetical protein DUK53_10320 [Listeria sp. SHR_NRA_18]
MTEEQLQLANIDFQVLLSDLPIEKGELITFLSAILANAKEAATQTDNGWITWRLQQQSGLFLLEIANATNMSSQAVMDHAIRPNLSSSKKEVRLGPTHFFS